MKKKLLLVLSCSLIALMLSACGGSKFEHHIAISQIVSHPSLNATKDGIIAALADAGLKEGENLKVDFHDAQNDPNNVQPISQKIRDAKPDVAIGIATPTAVGLVSEITDLPVVFAAISDPVESKLVAQYEKPGRNVTGGSDSSPESIQKLMDFIAAEFPEIKKLGIVMNNGEPNSVIMANIAEEQLKAHGIELVKAPIANASDIQQAAQSLVGRVDGLYITLDNTIVESIDTLIQVAYEHDLPFFSSDRDTVEAGTLATVGFKYFDHGYEVGQIVADILLNGTNPGDIDVLTPKKLDVIINETAAAEMGVTVTDSMKAHIQDKENNLLTK